MIKKKKRNLNFDKIPFDCWCHTLLFFESHKDFLSIVLVVKGLYEYVQTIYPSSTEWVDFSLYSIPKLETRHATRLDFPFENKDEFEKVNYFGYSSIGEVSESVFKKFPNMISFLLDFDDGYSSPECTFITRRFECQVVHQNLKNLSLYLDEISFFFDPPLFPNLKSLSICRAGYNYINILEEDDCELTILKYEKNLPKLKELDIERWKIVVFEGTREGTKILDYLSLENTVLTDGNISQFGKPKTLRLESFSIDFHVQQVYGMESLTNLFIGKIDDSLDLDDDEEFLTSHSISTNLFDNLQNLVKLKIFNNYKLTFQGTTLFVDEKSFPNLRKFWLKSRFRTRNDVFLVVLQHPSLLTLDVRCWGKFEFKSKMSLRDSNFVRLEEISIDRKILLNITNLKQLEYICLSNEKTKIPEEIFSNNLISFTDMKKLEDVDVDSFMISEFKNCPVLNEISFCPNSSEFDIAHCPSLNRVVLDFSECRNETDSQNIIKRLSKFEDVRVSYLILKNYDFPCLELTENDIGKDCKKLKVHTGCFKRQEEENGKKHCSRVVFKNLSYLEKIDLSESIFPTHLTISNLPNLEELDISQPYLFSSQIKSIQEILLNDLPSCKILRIGAGFATIPFTRIENVNVRELNVKLSKTKSLLKITETDFPHLSMLVIHDCERNDDDDEEEDEEDNVENSEKYMKIGVLSKLKKLEKIWIYGKSHNYNAIFSSVEGLDMKTIEVKCYEFDVGGGKFEEKIFTLNEYIEEVSRRDVKIDVL